MAGIYKKNLEVLFKFNPAVQLVLSLFNQIQDVEEHVELIDGILCFLYEDKFYQIHSRNKEEEAACLMNGIDYDKDNLIVVFGMGNMTFLRHLFRDTSERTKIAVFEPNLFIAKYILKHENVVDMVESGKMAFIFGDEGTINRSISLYFSQKWDNLAQNLMVISLPNYYLYSEYRLKCVRKISEIIDHMLKALGTSLVDMLDGFSHHFRNVDACLTANGLKNIKEKFEGYPAIIVASGPSLDKNIEYLKEAQGKALIFSCDASYRACMQNGVVPDAISSIERYYPTYQYFYENQEFDDKVVLIAPSLLHPEIFKTFKGRKILVAKSPDGLEGWWSSHFPNMEFLSIGHSCANTAYASAKAAGCDPIILIGQDLAFTDDKVHSESTHTRYEGVNQVLEDPDMVWVDGVDGAQVRTNIYYNLFRYFFEEEASFSGKHIIDATEGGALIKGSDTMTLKDAVERYCVKELPHHIYDLVEDIPYEEQKAADKYEELKESGEDIIRRLVEVQKRVVGHYEKLKKYRDYDFDGASEDELIQIVLNMRDADELIKYLVEEQSDLVSYYQQIIKQTIIYVKKIGNKLTGENVKRNWELQMNLMHMIDISCVATCKRFRNMTIYMDKKVNEIRKQED